MIRNAFGFAAREFQDVVRRFPLAVLCIVVFYILGNFDLPMPHNWHGRAFLLSYCGAFWFVSVQLFSESHALSIQVSNAAAFSVFLPLSGLALTSQVISTDALWYAFAILFILMFIAPFIRKNVTLKEAGRFYSEFWSHIGRTIPVTFVLFLIALAIFFWLYPVFGIPKHRVNFVPLSVLIHSLLFPMLALTGIPKIQKKYFTPWRAPEDQSVG